MRKELFVIMLIIVYCPSVISLVDSNFLSISEVLIEMKKAGLMASVNFVAQEQYQLSRYVFNLYFIYILKVTVENSQ